MCKYEIAEVCTHCDAENCFEWNTEEKGYVSECTSCKGKMMLCDECLHSEDNAEQKCDWEDDGFGGMCFRDNSLVKLSTYGEYDKENDIYSELFFSVPKNWLRDYVEKAGWKSLNEFLSGYIWDTTEILYEDAKADGVVSREMED